MEHAANSDGSVLCRGYGTQCVVWVRDEADQKVPMCSECAARWHRNPGQHQLLEAPSLARA